MMINIQALKFSTIKVLAVAAICGCSNIAIASESYSGCKADTKGCNIISDMAVKKVLYGQDSNIGIYELLRNLKGKMVTVYLSSGQSLTGVLVKNTYTQKLIHLTEIADRDFSDAKILPSSVVAVEVQVRKYK